MDVLLENEDDQGLTERNWFLKNDLGKGVVKDIRLEGVYLLSHQLSFHKKRDLLISYNTPLFKLHFEFDGDVKYRFVENNQKHVEIKKGTYELLYLMQHDKQIIDEIETKNSIELFFDEAFLKKMVREEFANLLLNLKENSKRDTSVQKGVFITDGINSVINEIKDCNYTGTKRQTFLELKIKELIIVAMTTYVLNYKKEEVLDYDVRSLQNVEEYIKLNLKKELTISELAVIAGLNTSKFKKCFKQIYEITVFKYITTLRIEKAKDLIQKENYTISQASYEVGYKNPQHFTVAFKKKLGYLPSQLKKNLHQVIYLLCINDFALFF